MFVFSFVDLIVGPIYFLLIYRWAKANQRKREVTYSPYKWYTKGLLAKMFAAIAVGVIYQFIYGGGDTINYFYSAKCVSNLLWINPSAVYDIIFYGDTSWTIQGAFTTETGYPMYMDDPHSFFIVRLTAPLCLLSFNSYFGLSLLLVVITYAGIWRLFLLFNYLFRDMEKELAIALLFVPSVVFWGSGILKDTVSLACVGLYTAHLYSMVVQNKYSISNFLFISLSMFLLWSIKPYILFALLPGSIIWIVGEQLHKISNSTLRTIMAPVLYSLAVFLGFTLLSQFGDLLGDYSPDKVFDKALVSNLDQKQGYYQGNSFDIGSFDPSAQGVLSKAHLAIFATLFRPMIQEANNPLMLLSGLENAYMLGLTLLLLLKLKFFGFFVYLRNNPLLLFSFLFAIFFSFSVGIATSNFGTLVRIRIPGVPFFVATVFVIKKLYERRRLAP